MPHLFDRRDWFGNSPAVWILAAMLFVSPLAWQFLQKSHVAHDVEAWLPRDTAHSDAFQGPHLSVSGKDRLLISWEGSSLGDPRIDTLQQKLEPIRDKDGVPRGGLPHIASVVDPRDVLLSMQQNDVPPQEAVRRLQGVLIGAGPLRVRLTDAGRSRLRRMQLELPEAAQRDLGLRLDVRTADAELSTTTLIPGIADEDGTVADAGSSAILSPAGDLEDVSAEHDLTITWNGIGIGRPSTLRVVEWLTHYRGANDATATPLVDRCFFVPGAPVALTVALSEAGLADPAEAIRLIRQAADDAGIPDDKLRLAGSPIVNVELDRAAGQAMWNQAFPWTQLHRRSALLASLIAAAILTFVWLRSMRLATAAVSVAVFSTYVSVSIIPATGASLNLLSMTIPILIVVMAMSSGMRVANLWNQAALTNSRTNAADACRAATWPCVLAAATLAVGAASLCISSLTPVREFGLYAAAGTMLSLPIVLYGMPSLLSLWKGAPILPEDIDRPGWRAYCQMLLLHRPGLMAIAVLAVCATAASGLFYVRINAAPIRCFADSSPIVQDARLMESHLSGITPVETIVCFDAAAQDEASFFDRMEMVRGIAEKLRRHPEIMGCFALADLQPVAEFPEDGASMLTRSRYLKRANLLQERIRGGEIEGATALYAVADLSSARHERGDELWRITARTNALSLADSSAVLRDVDEIAQSVLRFQPGARHVVAGDLTWIVRAEQAMQASCVWCVAIASGLILMVLVVGTKSVRTGLIGMVPGIASIATVYGVRSWLGIPIDLSSVIAAPIALGLAVQGSLDYLIELRRQITGCRTRQEAVAESLAACGPSIVQSSLIAAVAFLALIPAESPTIGGFGVLLTAMVGAALFGNVVLLPQLLASPVGWLIASGINSVRSAQGDAGSPADDVHDEPHEPPWETAA